MPFSDIMSPNLARWLHPSLLLLLATGPVQSANYDSLQVGNEACFYLSSKKIYPYIEEASTDNVGSAMCGQDLHLSVAEIANQRENSAVIQWLKCEMNKKIGSSKILIKFNPNGFTNGQIVGQRCYFIQIPDGTWVSSNDLDCVRDYTDPDGITSQQVHVLCKKKAACANLPPDCAKFESGNIYCTGGYVGKYSEAEASCRSIAAHLPFPFSPEETTFLNNAAGYPGVFLGLTTDVSAPSNCDKESCFSNGIGWYWKNELGEKLPLDYKSQFLNSNAAKFSVTKSSSCTVFMTGKIWTDIPCHETSQVWCQINPPSEYPLGPADFLDNQIGCSAPPSPPASSQMVLGFPVAEPVCVGDRARFNCSAGGVNKLQTNRTLDWFEATCVQKSNGDVAFDVPSIWPMCVSQLDCLNPDFDSITMKTSWDGSSTVKTGQTIQFTCIHPKKQLISKQLLASRLTDIPSSRSIETVCQLDGNYNQDINDFICTPACPFPRIIETFLLTHDWINAKDPPELGDEIILRCTNPTKKLLSRRELFQNDDSNLQSFVAARCLSGGQFNVSLAQFTCTKSCQLPSNNDDSIQIIPGSNLWWEYGQTIRFECKMGQKFVRIEDFEQPTKANILLLDHLLPKCQVSGLFQDILGSFVCTRNCSAPVWVPPSMKHNLSSDITQVQFGQIIQYECQDQRKPLADLRKWSPSKLTLQATCLLNGSYDHDIRDYDCTDCTMPESVPGGRFECQSWAFKVNTGCTLVCDEGLMPMNSKIVRTCVGDSANKSYWDISAMAFQCVQPVSLVIGGMDASYRHLSSVEVVAPAMACDRNADFPPYPIPISGAASGFVDGRVLVCGGNTYYYEDCELVDGANICDRNAECVESLGGSKWCSGIKTSKCFAFYRGLWSPAANLRTARAFSASVVLPSSPNRLWVLGGLGAFEELKTTEFVTLVEDDRWLVTSGPDLRQPRMGHCVAHVIPSSVLIAGGFASQTSSKYLNQVEIFDVESSRWLQMSGNDMNWISGPRIDAACHGFMTNGSQMLVMAGGWSSEGARQDTELFNVSSHEWLNVIGSGSLRSALPWPIRSATLAMLNNRPHLIGGVTCPPPSSGNLRPPCTRLDSVLQLHLVQTEPTFVGQWLPTSSRLKVARSGHVSVNVPKTLLQPCL